MTEEDIKYFFACPHCQKTIDLRFQGLLKMLPEYDAFELAAAIKESIKIKKGVLQQLLERGQKL